MLSPVKAIAAGVIVSAIGGALLVAQPFGQQGIAPGVESSAVAPVWVTATVLFSSDCDFGETTTEGGVTMERGMHCQGQTWTSDDPRLDGTANVAHNADNYLVDNRGYALVTSAVEVFNDAGGWRCTNADRVAIAVATLYSTSRFRGDRLTCVGYGGNEGYSAILTADWSGSPKTVEGLVFAGEMPPMPGSPLPRRTQ